MKFLKIKVDISKDAENKLKYDFGTLKSKNSYRNIPLSPFTRRELIKYKANHCIDTDNRIILNKPTYTIIVSLNKSFKSKGFNLTIDELRHTYATLLIGNGMNPKTASKILGYDVNETMRTYSHVTTDMFKNASKKIVGIFK